MMAAAVFLSEKIVVVQGLAVIVILFFATFLQASNKPYTEAFLNKLEVAGLLVSSMTMLLPLYMLTLKVILNKKLLQ